MVSRADIGLILNRVGRNAGLTTREHKAFAAWAHRWTPDWLSKPEYTTRTVETMARNAAAHAASLPVPEGEIYG